MIDAYAAQIEATSEGVVDKNESYAVAMDSSIRGIEQSNITIPKDETAFYGASLANLFKEEDEDNDQTLIAMYAEELQEAACIDTSVAYGIALDTYLSDPVIFRERMTFNDVSIEDTVVKAEKSEMVVDVDAESAPMNIESDVNKAATPAKSAQKSAKKGSVKKSAKKSASKNVSNSPLTRIGDNSIFSPVRQGSPFAKAVSAVKDVVSTVWETVVASPVRVVRESIGEVLGSPANVVGSSVDEKKLPEAAEGADNSKELLDAQQAESDVHPLQELEVRPDLEHESHSNAVSESDV